MKPPLDGAPAVRSTPAAKSTVLGPGLAVSQEAPPPRVSLTADPCWLPRLTKLPPSTVPLSWPIWGRM